MYDVEQKKLLKHVPTRWLSVGRCIDRLIKNWEPLRDFFEQEAQNNKNERTLGLKQFLGSRLNKLYCYYLRYVIAVFEKVNTVLQCEEPKVHKLHAILVAFFKELLIQLVTPSSIRKASSPLQVDFTLAANKRENEDLMIGQEARDFLSSSKLKPEKVGEFYASVKLFLQTSLIYLKHKLPFDNEILQKAQIADPEFQDAAR